MSAPAEVGGNDQAAARLARRAAANLVAWTMALVRPPRLPSRGAWSRLLGVRGVLSAAAAAAVIAGIMLVLDLAASQWTATLPPIVVFWFDEITDFGRSGWLLIPISALILIAALVSSPAIGRIANLVLISLVVRLGFAFAAIALPGLVFTVLKRIIGRVRPSDLGAFAYVPWSWRPEYASLPSGHTTTAFAAAVAIGAVWPRARIPMWAFAAVIGLSRVVINAHFVSDVVAGAFVGALGAILVRNWFAARRLGFVVRPDGRVAAMPGPSWRRVKAVAGRLFAQ